MINTNKIVDISHWTDGVDWVKASEDAPFIIFKGTQRTDHVDPMLRTYITKCEWYKIPYYIFAYLEKGNEAAQTAFLIRTCEATGLLGSYFCGYALDAEEKNSSEDLKKALNVFWQAGVNKALLYTMHSQYKYVKDAVETRPDWVAWWEARYGFNNGKYSSLFPCHKGVDLHQYSEHGKVDYISGTVDVNRLTGTKPLDWFIRHAGYFKKGETGATASPVKTMTYKGLDGRIFVFPSRGYWKLGDGMSTNNSEVDRDTIKDIQKLINWISGSTLDVDGKYGNLTRAAVIKTQELVGVKADGLFGTRTLEACLKYKK